MWLEGSSATGKNNEQSDIDVWLDVDDGTFEHCIVIFRRHSSGVGKMTGKTSGVSTQISLSL